MRFSLRRSYSFKIDFQPFYWIVFARNSYLTIRNRAGVADAANECSVYFRLCLTCSSRLPQSVTPHPRHPQDGGNEYKYKSRETLNLYEICTKACTKRPPLFKLNFNLPNFFHIDSSAYGINALLVFTLYFTLVFTLLDIV